MCCSVRFIRDVDKLQDFDLFISSGKQHAFIFMKFVSCLNVIYVRILTLNELTSK